MVNLKTHALCDYLFAFIFMAAPFAAQFGNLVEARNVFLSLGLGMAAYSLFSRYEVSMFKLLPLGLHMTLDVLVGVSIMMAPGIFDYRDALTNSQYAVHFILGLSLIGLVAFTRTSEKTQRASY